MLDSWTAMGTALTLGAVHALEVDHMVAVSVFVGRRPSIGRAVLFGARWGVGHSVVVATAGLVIVMGRITVPAGVGRWMEFAVGLTLVGLGIWAVRAARRLHVHDATDHGGADHAHVHLHSHDPHVHPHRHTRIDPDRPHRHVPTLIGALHGLAGAAPLAAILPVTLAQGPRAAAPYLVLFGVGTVTAMATYAGCAAFAVRAASRSTRVVRVAAFGSAWASIGVGVLWIVRAALARGA